MPPLRKSAVIAAVRAHLQARYDRIVGAALEARGYATDPGSKAESKYDTRSLEASYLAIGQGEQADELAAALRDFDAFDWPDFPQEGRVALGALVALDFDGDQVFALIAPGGGGVTCRFEGVEVTVVTPQAPLYARIAGRQAGETLPGPPLRILSVC
jgi:hypothetical protein